MTINKQHIRRLAMQVLYQIDQSGQTDAELLLQSLDEEHEDATVRARGVELALAAWGTHEQADLLIRNIAPDWPTHRQPPVDRAILRLAHHEIAAGLTPPKVAVNEAIELAKRFGSEQSPPFVNGVLDKLIRQLPPAPGSL